MVAQPLEPLESQSRIDRGAEVRRLRSFWEGLSGVGLGFRGGQQGRGPPMEVRLVDRKTHLRCAFQQGQQVGHLLEFPGDAVKSGT